MDTMTLGKKIKEARLELNLTQQEVAGDFITRNMLSQIENDLSTPSLKTIKYLAKKLNKPISYFLSNEFDEIQMLNINFKHYFEHASSLLKGKEYKKCIDYINQILISSNDTQQNLYYGRLQCILAKCKIEVCDYDSIEQILDDAVDVLEINKDYYYLANTYFYKSNVSFNNAKYEDAEVSVRKGIEELDKSYVNDMLLRIKLIFSLGFILYKLNKYEDSITNLNYSIELSKEYKTFNNYGDAHMTLGTLYKKMNDLDKAITYTEKAVSIFDALDEYNLKAKCEKNLGNYYLIINNFDNAFEHLNNSLIYFNEIKDDKVANTIKSDIHELLMKSGDYEKAIEYINEIDMNAVETVDKARIYMNLGNSYASIKDYTKAEENLKLAEELLKDSNRYNVLTLIYDSYSYMYSLIEDYEQAYKYSEKSKKFLELSLKNKTLFSGMNLKI